MKKKYITPMLEDVHLHLPVLMLDVSKDDSKTDDSDSDKSRSFWGPTIYDSQDNDDNDY